MVRQLLTSSATASSGATLGSGNLGDEGMRDAMGIGVDELRRQMEILRGHQVALEAAEVSRHDASAAELRQLRAEQVAAAAIHERKAAHAAQQEKAREELEGEARKWAQTAAEQEQTMRTLASEVSLLSNQ